MNGVRVRVLPTFRGNVLAADFPGWGDPNYADYLHRPTIGQTGTIVSVEQHGNAPFTRYAVRFDDGTRSPGLALGADVEML